MITVEATKGMTTRQRWRQHLSWLGRWRVKVILITQQNLMIESMLMSKTEKMHLFVFSKLIVSALAGTISINRIPSNWSPKLLITIHLWRWSMILHIRARRKSKHNKIVKQKKQLRITWGNCLLQGRLPRRENKGMSQILIHWVVPEEGHLICLWINRMSSWRANNLKL